MTNRSKKDYAYTILDVTEAISTACEERSSDREIAEIDGVIRIRNI